MYLQYYPVYVFFGILPSFLWLQFYLGKDVHPEPKPMILKIFFYGVLAIIPAILFELAIFKIVRILNFSPLISYILNMFLGVALTEELLKFSVIKINILKHPQFDEPVDAMVYMIIAGLGFAAGENTLILLPVKSPFWSQIFQVSLIRFLGATFLHALSCGILGFFIGLSFFKKDKKFVPLGLLLAVLLHGFYNLSIIEIEGNFKILTPFLLLLSSAIFVSFGFQRLKKMAESYKSSEKVYF